MGRPRPRPYHSTRYHSSRSPPVMFLGVDGGQSSTIAVIGDERGNIVGWATAGPCNPTSGDEGRRKFVPVPCRGGRPAPKRAGLDSPPLPVRRARLLIDRR